MGEQRQIQILCQSDIPGADSIFEALGIFLKPARTAAGSFFELFLSSGSSMPEGFGEGEPGLVDLSAGSLGNAAGKVSVFKRRGWHALALGHVHTRNGGSKVFHCPSCGFTRFAGLEWRCMGFS
jgi:hypothetical protein